MNAYDRMMRGRGQVGEVEIGVPAAQGDLPDGATYSQKTYKTQDRVDLAIYDGSAIVPGASHTVICTPSEPFKPETMTFPSWMTPGLVIQQIQIGALLLVDAGAQAGAAGGIPADVYSEVSTERDVDYPTIQLAQPVAITFYNDSNANITPRGCFRGKRLR